MTNEKADDMANSRNTSRKQKSQYLLVNDCISIVQVYWRMMFFHCLRERLSGGEVLARGEFSFSSAVSGHVICVVSPSSLSSATISGESSRGWVIESGLVRELAAI